MAEVKSEYIAVNELRALNKDATNMMFEGSRIRIAWSEGKRVWDVWETILSASNTISIESKATTLTKSLLNLKSYGTDRLGVQHDLGYTISVNGTTTSSIAANTSTSSKNHTVTVKQTNTGKSISVTATQAGRVATETTYKTPSVTSTSISTVPASGNVTRKLTVYWSQVKETTYDNGTTSTETVTGNSIATVTSGSANNSSGAYIRSGGVYVPSAGTTYYTSQRTAYTISKFTFTANNVSSGTVSRTVYVYQSANTRSTYYRNYKVSLSASPDPVASYGQTTTISVTSTKESYYSYASGSTQTIGTVSCNATLSSSDGQFYKSGSYVSSITVSNGGSATFLPNNNFTASSRTVNVKATNADSTSTAYTLGITQKAAEFEFYFKETSSSIDSSGGPKELTLVNSINGGYLAISESNFSMTNGSISNVEVDDLVTPMVEWKVTVNVNSNSSSSRNAVVTAIQPTSGNKATHTISQSGVSSVSGYVTINQLVDSLYISGSTISGFSSVSRFTIAASGGTLPASSYMFSLYFKVTTTDGETIEARYDYEDEYISFGSVSSSTTVYFVNFPTYIDLQELSWFDPSYMTIQQVEVRPELTWKSGSKNLFFKQDYVWYAYN